LHLIITTKKLTTLRNKSLNDKIMSQQIIGIVAYTHITRAIGKNGDLPWKSKTTLFKEDIRFFKKTTTETKDPNKVNAVIMGRKTWESIPIKNRPLLKRLNVILSKTLDPIPDVILEQDFVQAIEHLKQNSKVESIFVIGGGTVYKTAMDLKLLDQIYTTQIFSEFENCDTFFSEILHSEYTNELLSCGPNYAIIKYSQIQKHEEYQYLNLIKEILTNGTSKNDRTKVGTKSVFGRTMRFSLRNGTIPLLTTKRTFWKGVAVELLWFISGNTSVKILQNQGVGIWDANSTRKYLDSIGLTDREEGDLGPVYGFQWRHFGAKYTTMHDDYSGKGKDQLIELIDTIKNNPDSRRMILSAWNPVSLSEMSLPACHVLSQFYVANGELSCQMYQRSADMGLGVPFNIASYALLTHLLAKCCDLKTGDFIHIIGDCHVYTSHELALTEQLLREPRPFPKIMFKTDNQNIENFKYEDFELIDYNPHKPIKMDMAV
jgi:dihydrofolate reductase/thymidylate synthase